MNFKHNKYDYEFIGIIYTLKTMCINSMEINHCGYTQVVSSEELSYIFYCPFLETFFGGESGGNVYENYGTWDQ